MTPLDISEEARNDLILAELWIAARNREAATRWRAAVEAKFALIADMPGVGTPQDDIRSGMRCVFVGPYSIYYAAEEARLMILRVLHMKRDHDAIFRGEE